MGSVLRSILIIHPGGLGDVLLAVPALQAIRFRFPKHEVTLLAGTEVGRLLHVCGVIDCVVPIEAGHLATLFAGPPLISQLLQQTLERCDLAIGWLSDSDGALHATLQSRGIPRIILQRPEGKAACHQSERFLASVQNLLAGHDHGPLRLTLPDSLLQAGLEELKKSGLEAGATYVVCHPGSGSLHKLTRPQVLLDLLAGCRDRALIPVIVVGPADENAVQALGEEELKRVPVLRPKSLNTLAGILARAKGFIGHDSGVTHLSALVGVPTVAMFGPTDPHRWAPRGPHVALVTGASCSCAGWDAIRACVEKPCLNIHASTVLQRLDGLLFRYRQVTNS